MDEFSDYPLPMPKYTESFNSIFLENGTKKEYHIVSSANVLLFHTHDPKFATLVYAFLQAGLDVLLKDMSYIVNHAPQFAHLEIHHLSDGDAQNKEYNNPSTVGPFLTLYPHKLLYEGHLDEFLYHLGQKISLYHSNPDLLLQKYFYEKLYDTREERLLKLIYYLDEYIKNRCLEIRLLFQ